MAVGVSIAFFGFSFWYQTKGYQKGWMVVIFMAITYISTATYGYLVTMKSLRHKPKGLMILFSLQSVVLLATVLLFYSGAIGLPECNMIIWGMSSVSAAFLTIVATSCFVMRMVQQE